MYESNTIKSHYNRKKKKVPDNSAAYHHPYIILICTSLRLLQRMSSGYFKKRQLMLSKRSGGFPGVLVVKNSPANARDMGLIPGSGRSPGEGNGNPVH